MTTLETGETWSYWNTEDLWEYGRAPSRSNAPKGGAQHLFHFKSQSQNGYMYHSLNQWQQDRQAACAASPPEKCNYFLLLSWWWCNTTMGEVHLVVDDNIGYVHFSFDRYSSWGERKYAVLTTCIMLFIPSRFRDSLATMQNELTKRCLWP